MVCCPDLVSAHVCPLFKFIVKMNLVPLERLKCKTGGGRRECFVTVTAVQVDVISFAWI